MLTAWFVDSWRRVDSFIVYKIVMRRDDGSQWSVERRYSELFAFHQQVVLVEFGLSLQQKNHLSALFPAKNVFTRQTDAFADNRARAIDAYLQTLKAFMKRLCWNHPSVQDFFQIPEPKHVPQAPFSQLSTPKPEEWRELMAKGERLFELFKQDHKFASELDDVLGKLHSLIQHREFQGEERRYYDLKREIELYKIKHGLIDSELKESFSLQKSPLESPVVHTFSQTEKTPASASDQRTQLRYQDAILFDLEATVTEQKHLSMALAEEVEAHNRIASELQEKGDSSLDQLKASTKRVEKI